MGEWVYAIDLGGTKDENLLRGLRNSAGETGHAWLARQVIE